MANLAAKAPTEPEKQTFLHDRSNRPDAPKRSIKDYALEYAPMILGALFALGAVALGFQTRASWDGHRDWVVPTTIPVLVAAAVMLAAATWRQKLEFAMPAYAFLSVGLVFTILNIIRGIDTHGHDYLRDFYSIAAAVMYGCAIVAAISGWTALEVRHPIKAPQPEM